MIVQRCIVTKNVKCKIRKTCLWFHHGVQSESEIAYFIYLLTIIAELYWFVVSLSLSLSPVHKCWLWALGTL